MRIATSLGAVAALMTLHAPASVAQEVLGIFEGHTDVGKVSRPGAVSYDPELQQYTISGSGQNMWGAHDDFISCGRR